MLNQIIFITYLYFIYGLYANGLFYNKFYGFATKENFISYKAFKDIQSDLVCLNLCNREVDCLAAYFNGKIQTCLLYNYRIAPDSLISQLLGVYFLAQRICTEDNSKSCINSTISYYNRFCLKIDTLNGTSLPYVLGIVELNNDSNNFIITDKDNNRILKLNKHAEFIKSNFMIGPVYITKSSKYIYVNSNFSSIMKFDFELAYISTIFNGSSINGIHFELTSGSLFVVSSSNDKTYVLNTNDEINFNEIKNISVSIDPSSITIFMDKIYIGTSLGHILVYNKTNHNYISNSGKISLSYIRSVNFDCHGNMIYSCWSPPLIYMLNLNGTNLTMPMNNLFSNVQQVYVDSMKRLWIGGVKGFAIFT